MKKHLFKIFICFTVCILAGCSRHNVSDVEIETFAPTHESSIPAQTNPVDTSEPASTPLETPNDKVVFDKLSGEEKRKLNVFFSNFAEAYFDEYDYDHISADNLFEFAFIHNRVNGTSKEEYDMFTSSYFEHVMGIRVQVMDKIINKYFGVCVPHEDAISLDKYGRYHGWAFKDGYVYTGAASGEFYDYCAVTTTLVDIGDGTYLAKYDKYSTDVDMMNKKYYSYTPEQAHSDPALKYCSSYTAVIKPAVVEGKETWQLLKLKKV